MVFLLCRWQNNHWYRKLCFKSDLPSPHCAINQYRITGLMMFIDVYMFYFTRWCDLPVCLAWGRGDAGCHRGWPIVSRSLVVFWSLHLFTGPLRTTYKCNGNQTAKLISHDPSRPRRARRTITRWFSAANQRRFFVGEPDIHSSLLEPCRCHHDPFWRPVMSILCAVQEHR